MKRRGSMIQSTKFKTIDRIDEIISGRLDKGFYKINAAVVFLDMEGYTQIVYQCANDKTNMWKFCTRMTEFWKKMEVHGLDKSIIIINNAGDGFLALSDDPKMPKTNASVFSAILKEEFESSFAKFPTEIGYRFKPRIRIGLHFGKIYFIRRESTKSGFENIYIGDALNVAARIASSNTARKFQIACSKEFYDKLSPGEKDKYKEGETYYDLNKYPEPIVLYGYSPETP